MLSIYNYKLFNINPIPTGLPTSRYNKLNIRMRLLSLQFSLENTFGIRIRFLILLASVVCSNNDYTDPMSKPHKPIENRLLAALPASEYQRLVPPWIRLALPRASPMSQKNQSDTSFPHQAIVSLVSHHVRPRSKSV